MTSDDNAAGDPATLRVNQAEIAGLLNVSRGTVTSRQRLGLPFETGGYQKSNLYDPVACCYWDAGRQAAETRDKPVDNDPHLVAAIGFLVAQNDARQAAAMLVTAFGLDPERAVIVAGRAQGWWIGVEGGVPVI